MLCDDSKLIVSNIQWTIQYIHTSQNDGCIHQIIISKHDALSEEQMEPTKEAIKSYSTDQLFYLIENTWYNIIMLCFSDRILISIYINNIISIRIIYIITW